MVHHTGQRLRHATDGAVVDDLFLMRLFGTPVILIVDDDTSTRSLLMEVLSMEGYRAESAPDGRKALELLRTRGPYVVVLDLIMPYMDGLELLTALKSTPDVRRAHWIILMSGRINLKEVAATHGADSSLVKPFHIDQFLDVVNEGLRGLPNCPDPDSRN